MYIDAKEVKFTLDLMQLPLRHGAFWADVGIWFFVFSIFFFLVFLVYRCMGFRQKDEFALIPN